jgi:hypothetical protein
MHYYDDGLLCIKHLQKATMNCYIVKYFVLIKQANNCSELIYTKGVNSQQGLIRLFKKI